MKAYVAGRFSDHETVRQAQRMLRAVGYEITFDWTRGGLADGVASPALARELAEKERMGVVRANLFVLLWKHDDSFERVPIGKLIEFGIATATNTRIIVVGDPPESIFWHLRDVERVPDLDGLARLLGFLPSESEAA